MSITEVGTVKYYDNNGNEMSINEAIDYCFAEGKPVETEKVHYIIPCSYCEDDIEVETIKIDGVYYISPEINYCPFCGRKLGDRK